MVVHLSLGDLPVDHREERDEDEDEPRDRRGVSHPPVDVGLLVDVVGERFESWASTGGRERRADYITTRAVSARKKLLASMRELLEPGGKGVFVTTPELTARIQKAGIGWKWQVQLSVPHTSGTVILICERESQ